MLVYFNIASGDITHTMNLQGGLTPPAGDYIEVGDMELDLLLFHVVDGFLELREAPTDAQRQRALETIQKTRGELRARFITDLPGQDMVYLEKRGEAIAFLAHPEPTPALFPMVYAEVGVTGDTAYEVAQVWINMNDMWRLASTVIEAATLTASRHVTEASTVTQIDNALTDLNAAISVLG